MSGGGRRFRFGFDPLCLAAIAAYAANRWLVKPRVAAPFFHEHFNDLLLIPALLPWVLWLHRAAGWRGDEAPTAREVAGHWLVWSLICELLAPRWLPHGTADWRDVVAYAAGAAAAWGWWKWSAQRRS